VDNLALDLTGVADWMSNEGLGDGPIDNVSAIVGGTQNIMLRFTRSGRDYVLRRGPQHLHACRTLTNPSPLPSIAFSPR
jgi:aminoglycoside phosphotransferase (APT) family kinase protein